MHNTTSVQYVLERAGCSLHYWLTGPDDRPLVVFTHGATVDHEMFDAQVSVIAQHYRVLTWDVRGHGQSQPMDHEFTIRTAVEDLVAILDLLGYKTATFVGFSMGGSIIQELVFFTLNELRPWSSLAAHVTRSNLRILNTGRYPSLHCFLSSIPMN